MTFQAATLLKLWTIAFGRPGRIYVGTIPGGLFESDESFALNLPLWNHSSRGGDLFDGDGSGRTHWEGTPASEGGEFAAGMHSILVDPRDDDRMLVAVSTAGVLETGDGGKTWRSRNRGLLMDFLPNPEAEWGHDPHDVELCPGQPDHVWQQNHCGVFYSADGAATWTKVSDPGRGVHFGFPVAVDAEDGRTAWVVPGEAVSKRMAIDGGLFVARTGDGGQTWEQLRKGLPQENAYDVVLRHALANSGAFWPSAAPPGTCTSARIAANTGPAPPTTCRRSTAYGSARARPTVRPRSAAVPWGSRFSFAIRGNSAHKPRGWASGAETGRAHLPGTKVDFD